jgi:2-keto-4-pentenoate hydratase/2-oxohepta-3-ene-1,7-dioic acid hydratase in catechol pathway
MSYARLAHRGRIAYARLEGAEFLLLEGPPWSSARETGMRVAASEVSLRFPAEPSKIVCVGLNYASHVAESLTTNTIPDEPVLFLKPPSALLSPGWPIVIPEGVGRVDHEAELALVIGHEIRRAEREEAREAIFGITALNDVTARVLQKKDGQWTRAKGFDGFCPLGPVLACGRDPDDVTVRARVNGEVRQEGHTRDLLVSCADLVAYISRVMSLLPGDVISTGTPSGIGPIVAGDRVEIEVEGVGVLANPVSAETPSPAPHSGRI